MQERTRWRHAAHPFVSSARYFQAPSTQANAAQPHSITEIAPPQPFLCLNRSPIRYDSVADPGVFLGGGALVSCSTSTPINHIFFWQNTSCIRKPQVISGGEGAHPLHPPTRSAPGFVTLNWEHKLGFLTTLISLFICVLISPQNSLSVQCRGLGTLRRFLFPGRLLRF